MSRVTRTALFIEHDPHSGTDVGSGTSTAAVTIIGTARCVSVLLPGAWQRSHPVSDDQPVL